MNDQWDNEPPRPPNPYHLDKRITLVEQSQETIKEELSKINASLSKLVWVILSAVVLGVVNAAMSGSMGHLAAASGVGS